MGMKLFWRNNNIGDGETLLPRSANEMKVSAPRRDDDESREVSCDSPSAIVGFFRPRSRRPRVSRVSELPPINHSTDSGAWDSRARSRRRRGSRGLLPSMGRVIFWKTFLRALISRAQHGVA